MNSKKYLGSPWSNSGRETPCDTHTGNSRYSAPVKNQKKSFFKKKPMRPTLTLAFLVAVPVKNKKKFKKKTHATPTMAFLVTVPLFYNFFCFTFLF